MEKERYYFGFRFDFELGERIDRYCFMTGETLNQLVEKAFCFTARLHDRRNILFDTYSGFCSRPLFEGKVTAMLILKAEIREMVRNFAVCYRRSMAEILRVSLEVYLDMLVNGAGKIDDVKHYYRQPRAVITQTLFTLFPQKFPLNSHYPSFLKPDL